MKHLDSLRDLFVEQLRDLYDAENRLLKALPKMAEKASTKELKTAFEEHLEETRGQVDRLKQVFEHLGVEAKGETCEAMKGLVAEGEEVMKKKDMTPEVLDAALIAAAQRVEHYEIAGYGTVTYFADLLGEDECKKLLGQTLDQEKSTDEKLNKIAKSKVNREALQRTTA